MSHNGHGPDFSQFFWLLLMAFVVALAARRLRVPYALALVITGVAVGVSGVLPGARLQPGLLFNVFLPPLLFESAIHLPLGELRRNWKAITIFTFGGTLLSTFLVAGLMSHLMALPLASALVFGALISATDPISVLAIFKRLNAGRRLTLIMEAESLFNDGVAVVLFTVLTGAALGASASLGDGAMQFARLVLGGIVMGASLGALASRVHYELDDHLVEITLTSVVAFGSYALAEALHLSGVMAVVSAGLVIGNYGMPRTMSPGTRLAVTAFWEYAGFVVNSLLFLLIGIEVTSLAWSGSTVALALGAAAIVLAGRATIYPLWLLVNILTFDTRRRLPWAWTHVLVWGGLRGALSMALVLGLSASFPARQSLVAATFGVVVFSLLAQGLTIGPLLKRLGLTRAKLEASPPQRQLAGELVACQAALSELERVRGQESYPNWAVESLIHDYRQRLKVLADSMTALYPEHEALQEREARNARRLVLQAQKGAWQESQNRGWLDADDWRELAAHIDSQLLELQQTGK